jgi:hypothetical protein
MQLWSRELPGAFDGQHVNFVALDFFKEGPVKDQDIYYVNILFQCCHLSLILSVSRCDRSYITGQMILSKLFSDISEVL